MKHEHNRAIGILSAEIHEAEGEFQIFPAGEFRASDGRPVDAAAYVLEESQAAQLIAAHTAQKNPLMVDYEHQAVLAKQNGKPAPAAGWVHSLEWRPGKGLFATGVKWTQAAKTAILADEYRYISPVFRYDRKTGAIASLFNVALTNIPALDGMEAAVAHSLQLEASPESKEWAALKKETEDLRLELAGLNDSKRELAQEKTAMIRRDANDFVGHCLMTGRIDAAEIRAATELAQYNLSAFKALVENRPEMPQMQSERAKMAQRFAGIKALGLTPSDLHLCQLTGKDPAEFARLKAEDSSGKGGDFSTSHPL
ncbi:MAG: phage protease [Zoogloeaceae bacterium]|jgi:phage I-like protein|nr:phage protease [Zoogloeaceae bacterium]